jgi:hypothetical protein
MFFVYSNVLVAPAAVGGTADAPSGSASMATAPNAAASSSRNLMKILPVC